MVYKSYSSSWNDNIYKSPAYLYRMHVEEYILLCKYANVSKDWSLPRRLPILNDKINYIFF